MHDDISAIVTNDDALGKYDIFNIFCPDFLGLNIRDIRYHKSYRPVTTDWYRYAQNLKERKYWIHSSSIQDVFDKVFRKKV